MHLCTWWGSQYQEMEDNKFIIIVSYDRDRDRLYLIRMKWQGVMSLMISCTNLFTRYSWYCTFTVLLKLCITLFNLQFTSLIYQCIYSSIHLKVQNIDDGKKDVQFFKESSEYWRPQKTANAIYGQLASKRFREIPRQRIQWVWINGWMDGQMDGWMDRWMNGWMMNG